MCSACLGITRKLLLGPLTDLPEKRSICGVNQMSRPILLAQPFMYRSNLLSMWLI